MTNEQLYFVIGIPMVFNLSVIGLLIGLYAKMGGIDAKFEAIDAKFEAINARFDAIDKRFDDMRDLWRAELRRVEEIIDARLKHLEERG